MTDQTSMTPEELVELGRAVFGQRWVSPLAKAIGCDRRDITFWRRGDRRITGEAARKIRELALLGPIGNVIRDAVKSVLPDVKPSVAHSIATVALNTLTSFGLLDGAGAVLKVPKVSRRSGRRPSHSYKRRAG